MIKFHKSYNFMQIQNHKLFVFFANALKSNLLSLMIMQEAFSKSIHHNTYTGCQLYNRLAWNEHKTLPQKKLETYKCPICNATNMVEVVEICNTNLAMKCVINLYAGQS